MTRLTLLHGLRDQLIRRRNTRGTKRSPRPVGAGIIGKSQVVHGVDDGRDTGLALHTFDSASPDLHLMPTGLTVLDGEAPVMGDEATGETGGVDGRSLHVSDSTRTVSLSQRTGENLSEMKRTANFDHLSDLKRTASGQPPISRSKPVRNEADRSRTTGHGHLSEVPAAYKRGQGDRAADWRASIATRHALEVALEVARNDLEIAHATNRVLTEALYTALENRIDTTRIRPDLTETETPPNE